MRAPTTTSDRRRRRLAWCCALAALPLLSGCIAAFVAVPAMTAAGVFSERKRVRAATAPTLAPVVTIDAEPEPGAPPEAALAPVGQPPSPPGPVDEQWQPFVNYTLARAYSMRINGEQGQSALLTPDSRFDLTPSHLPCRASEPAVVVDLDVGSDAFAPATATQAAPGLAAALAQLRSNGIVVLWLSQIDANQVNEVAQALRDSGLDAGGRDPLLLVRNSDERKQVLLDEANEDVCVLAILGDRRGDFDELFNYLREPDAASGLDALVGNGWFLLPAPLMPPASTAP